MTTEILLAGFGGQGVLFAGKILANCGLMDSKELSWLPSYGPEMRGGTANCSVCISDEPIGSPLVLAPDILIAMNQPSYDKFINAAKEPISNASIYRRPSSLTTTSFRAARTSFFSASLSRKQDFSRSIP